jgi:hypothetical protein
MLRGSENIEAPDDGITVDTPMNSEYIPTDQHDNDGLPSTPPSCGMDDYDPQHEGAQKELDLNRRTGEGPGEHGIQGNTMPEGLNGSGHLEGQLRKRKACENEGEAGPKKIQRSAASHVLQSGQNTSIPLSAKAKTANQFVDSQSSRDSNDRNGIRSQDARPESSVIGITDRTGSKGIPSPNRSQLIPQQPAGEALVPETHAKSSSSPHDYMPPMDSNNSTINTPTATQLSTGVPASFSSQQDSVNVNTALCQSSMEKSLPRTDQYPQNYPQLIAAPNPCAAPSTPNKPQNVLSGKSNLSDRFADLRISNCSNNLLKLLKTFG